MRLAVRVVQYDGVARMVGAATDTIFPSARNPVLTENGEPHVFTSSMAAAMWIDDFKSRGHERGYACDIQDLDDPERGSISEDDES